MAPLTRRNSELSNKIATLRLRLTPLVRMPEGPVHPNFPATLLEFHLLTEEQLDSLAHFYDQSTPGPFSHRYPSSMNWDKDFLAKIGANGTTTASDFNWQIDAATSAEAEADQNHWVNNFMATVDAMQHPQLSSLLDGAVAGRDDDSLTGSIGNTHAYAHLSDLQRVAIKRRKVGKFIGLGGMDTPAEEVAGRIQANLELAIQQGQDELRRHEEMMMGWRKTG